MIVGKVPTAWAGWDYLTGQWSDFAQLCNRVWEGQQTDNSVIQIKTLTNTDIASLPDEFVKVYLYNYLAG